MSAIVFKDLKKIYGKSGKEFQALSGVSFKIEEDLFLKEYEEKYDRIYRTFEDKGFEIVKQRISS